MKQFLQTNFSKTCLCLVLLCTYLQLAGGNTAIAQGRNDTINIDFGNSSRISTGGWNNITDSKAGAVADLINYQGISSGIAVAVTDPFNDGSNTAGAVADDSLRLPSTAATDSFFGSKRVAIGGGETTGGVTFSNLNVQTPYSFAIFASRPAPDNRETKYTFSGLTTEVVTLNPEGAKAFFSRVKGMLPAADGTITITATTGDNNTNADGYYYLGAIRVTYRNTAEVGPKAVALTYPNGGELWEAGKEVFIGWQSENIVSANLDYSTDNGTTWTTIATEVPAVDKRYTWTVPATFSEQARVRITDAADATVTATSINPFTILADNGKEYTLVVLGSSTAAGVGPTSQDSAWVWRYSTYLTQMNTDFTVVNLAVGGYTTGSILPTVNPNNNITKALSYDPAAIIINMPSNDAATNVPVATQLANYDQVAQLAAAAEVPVWVTTPQPRNFNGDQARIQLQLDMIAATKEKFGEKTIDFWTGFEDETNQMKAIYNSGDGIHMNNLAHRIMFERMVAMEIDQAILADNVLSSPREQLQAAYSVYPNPSFGQINVVPQNGAVIQKVSLFTTTGKKVLEQEFGSSSVQTIDAAKLGHGLYLVRVQTSRGEYVSRLVLQ